MSTTVLLVLFALCEFGFNRWWSNRDRLNFVLAWAALVAGYGIVWFA